MHDGVDSFEVACLVIGMFFILFAGPIQAVFASDAASMSRLGQFMVGGKTFVQSRVYRWLLRLMGAVMIGVAVASWLWF